MAAHQNEMGSYCSSNSLPKSSPRDSSAQVIQQLSLNDVHAAANTSVTNGVAKSLGTHHAVHTQLQERQYQLREICLSFEAKVTAFLKEKGLSPRLKNVQTQVVVAMGVIKEALNRWR